MKKLVIPVVVLVIGLVLFLSCGEAGMEESKNVNEYDFMGKWHNAGLDTVYLKLESVIHEKGSITNEERETLIYRAIKDFSQSKYNINDVTFGEIYHVAEEITKNRNSLLKTLTEEMDYSDSLTNNQYQLSSEFFEIFDESTSCESFILSINDFEIYAGTILLDDEKELIFSMTSVAKYSTEYWDENISKWEDLLGDDNTLLHKTQASWGQWRQFILGDLTGALIGSVIAGPVGALPCAISGSVLELVHMIDDELKE